MTDFRKVNTASARYQQLSLNPQKLAGQCGKLKCCLNFELDTYLDALKSFPKQDTVLETEKGKATFVKMDIFKGLLWYNSKEEGFKWFKLTLEQVQEVIEMNKRGEKAPSLEELESETAVATKIDFENVVGQDSLTRFDKPKSKNKRRNNRRKKPGQGQRNSGNSPQNKQGNQNRPKGNNPNQKGQNSEEPSQGAAKKRRPKKRNQRNPNAAANAQQPGNVKTEGTSPKPRRNKRRNKPNNNNKPDANASKDA